MPRRKIMARKINLIVIHCSATKANQDYTPDQLRRDHLARGFNSAGYHFYVRKSGYRHIFRPIEEAGAHAKGYNAHSIGVCYEGGLADDGKGPKDTRNTQQKEALTALLTELKEMYPKARITGHRDLSPDLDGDGVIEPNEWVKWCPGFDAKKEYKNL